MRLPPRFVAAVLAAPAAACARPTTDHLPPGWRVEAAESRIESGRGRCASASPNEWAVALDAAGRPRFAPAGETMSVELPVAGGRLVGVDRGEFGGALIWKSDGGDTTEIHHENIRALIGVGGGVYAFGGLAHLSMNDGRMLRVERDAAGRWRVAPIRELAGAPAAIVRMGDSILVVTYGALEVVHPDGSGRVVHRNELWGYLYPNSVVVARDGTVYVGMRSAVARLTRVGSGYREEWLTADC